MNSVYLHQIINHSMYSELKIKLPIYAYCSTHIDTFKLDVYVSQFYFNVTSKVLFSVAISWGNKMSFSLSANMSGFCSDSHN